ncbi:MAG: hypothetical protein HGB10_05525, partial [Coriobacteriia bacterium]|nr:hypothetical protein [Coriobacteriia bacterium]
MTRSIKDVCSRVAFGALFVALFMSVASSASAALPVFPAERIKFVDWETPASSIAGVKVNPVLPGEPATTAWWARQTRSYKYGLYGFYCAAAPTASTAIYPDATRGIAYLDVPELADYYSADVVFWYVMRGLGSNDERAFRMGWKDVAADRSDRYDTFSVSTSWRLSPTINVTNPSDSVNLSRRAAQINLQFLDNYWPNTNHAGPTVDDLAVWAYKYGPVVSINATTLAPTATLLAWSPPRTSTGSSEADTRTIGYRIWRAQNGTDVWTELTATARVVGNTYLDLGVVDGLAYKYVIQAWDPDSGSGRGTMSSPFTWPSSLTAPSAPTLASTAQPFASSGSFVLPRSAGTTVALDCSRDMANVSNSFVAVTAADGLVFSGSIQLADQGIWYLRSRYSVPGQPDLVSNWRQVSALPPASSVTTPSAPVLASTAAGFTSTLTVLPAHSAGATVAIECSQNQSTVATTVVATVGGDGTTYSGDVKLPSSGTWYLRARHADSDHYPTTSTGWRQVSALPPASSVTTPSAPALASTAAGFTSTLTVLPAHSAGATVAIECSQNQSTVATTVVATVGGDGT